MVVCVGEVGIAVVVLVSAEEVIAVFVVTDVVVELVDLVVLEVVEFEL